jgi:hypothetical protein
LACEVTSTQETQSRLSLNYDPPPRARKNLYACSLRYLTLRGFVILMTDHYILLFTQGSESVDTKHSTSPSIVHRAHRCYDRLPLRLSRVYLPHYRVSSPHLPRACVHCVAGWRRMPQLSTLDVWAGLSWAGYEVYATDSVLASVTGNRDIFPVSVRRWMFPRYKTS